MKKQNLFGQNRGSLTKRTAVLIGCMLFGLMAAGCGGSWFDYGNKNGGDYIDTSPGVSEGRYDTSVDYEGGDLYADGVSGENGGTAWPGDGAYDVSADNDRTGNADREKGAGQDPLQGRKLISRIDLDVETREFDEALSTLESRVRELGGYVENRNTYYGSSYSQGGGSRHGTVTIRIPQDALWDFLDTVSNVSNVVRRSEEVEDVTLAYADMEGRRNTLLTEQDRLLEFLGRADNIEEIIVIEERLSNVRYQLESMESRLRIMDNQVDYATVYISISEVAELTPVEEQTVWDRIQEGFLGTLREMGSGTADFFVWFLTYLPYMLLWGGLPGLGILLLWKRHKRKHSPGARTKDGGAKEQNEKEQSEKDL